jgi:hypothetical protein
MAQITNVTSESLQAQVRRLLPSQQGFGEDLQASNVITPIIDLTSTAEGSVLPQNLQTAIDTSTGFELLSLTGTTTIITTTGFWRLFGTITHKAATVGVQSNIILNDGLTDNTIYQMLTDSDTSTDDPSTAITFDLIVFVNSGNSVKINANNNNQNICISYRQIADINGNLTNPTGFSFE